MRLWIVMAASAALLGACAANRGLTQTRPDARPYAEAHAECWVVAMDIGGNSATYLQTRAYDSCMAQYGWADQRSLM
jgi:hypothetical protein